MIAFYGIDTIDPFSKNPRDTTVAVLVFTKVLQLITVFEIPMGRVQEISGGILAIDGPQGLANIGERARTCERLLHTPGRTPDFLPVASRRPFSGYIRGNILLFQRLMHLGRRIDKDLIEVYPGAVWPQLSQGKKLYKKQTVEGRAQRLAILLQLGIKGLNYSYTHDDLDSILAAYIAYSFWNGSAVAMGQVGHNEEHYWREGVIWILPNSLTA